MRTCGKASTYNAGCRCAHCREANRVHMSASRARAQRQAKVLGIPAQSHGLTAYAWFGCRCLECREAKSRTNRKYYENQDVAG